MNKIKNSSMFLLWAGAAISISEIYTGGIIAPLGFSKGLLAIIIGHIIGTGFLAFGGYISFRREKNAMESAKSSMGSYGVKVIAFLNVLQLIGWSAIMIIQAGRALNLVFPVIPGNIAVFIMAAAVMIWVYSFNNYSKILNDFSVIALIILCILLFWKIDMRVPLGLKGSMSFATAIELSIAMPISWLPLIGDYTKNAGSKSGAFHFSFLGYFLGSVLMFVLGLLITIYSGKDIIEFISTSYIKILACIVIVLSTTTTTFLDIYSAVASSKQIFKVKKEGVYFFIYVVIAAVIAYLFPIEQYQNFLLTIGSIFVPVYTIIFIEYILKREKEERKFNALGMISALAGTIIYYFLTRFGLGIPTVLVVCSVLVIYFILSKLFTIGGLKHENKVI